MDMIDSALLRIRIEYIEMPDLKLTPAQARRLWNLPQDVCDAALARLVGTGFLCLNRDGRFLRGGLGHEDAAVRPRFTSARPDAA